MLNIYFPMLNTFIYCIDCKQDFFLFQRFQCKLEIKVEWKEIRVSGLVLPLHSYYSLVQALKGLDSKRHYSPFPVLKFQLTLKIEFHLSKASFLCLLLTKPFFFLNSPRGLTNSNLLGGFVRHQN